MDGYLKTLLISAVIVSFIFSCSAQNATSSEEAAPKDIQTSVICIPGTNICNPQHIESVVTDTTEEAVGDVNSDTTKPTPFNVCNPFTKVCEGPKPGNFATDDSPVVESSGEEDDASIHDPTRIICDPITKKCKGPNPSTSSALDSSAIHGEEETVSPLVCDLEGTCQDPHHGFGVAQPRIEAL